MDYKKEVAPKVSGEEQQKNKIVLVLDNKELAAIEFQD